MARSFRLTPPPLDTTIDRPRLLVELRRRFDVTVTSIVAGAGFGKSVLLAQAIRDNIVAPRGTDLWLSCDADDSLASNLVRGLAESAALDHERTTDGRDLLVRVAERWPTGVCLVLDDVHLISDGSAGANALRAMVADAPPGVSFVLASRRPIPGLARLRAQGRVLELDEEVLGYRPNEIEQLGGSVSSDLGGWPALISLATSFGFGAAREFVFEELVASIDAPTRRALAALALIGGADSELATVALGAFDATSLLALPLVRRDGPHIVPHALWGELLADELDVDQAAEILGRVGRALLEQGDEIRAGSAFVAAGDTEGLRLAVRVACAQGYASVPGEVLATWWDALGAEDRQSHVGLFVHALVRRTTDPFSDATRDALAAAVAACRETGDTTLEIAALWEFGFVSRARGEVEAMLDEVPQVLALEARGESLATPLATMARAVISDALGDQAAASTHLAALDTSTVARGWRAPVEFMRMLFAFNEGDVDAARAASEAFLDHAPDDYPGREFVRPWVDWLDGRPPENWDALPLPGSDAGSTAADQLWSGASVGLMLAYADLTERADRSVAVATDAAERALLPYMQAFVAGARAAARVAYRDEDGATTILIEVTETAASVALAERGLRYVLPVAYVLVPALREQWDAADLGPLHDRSRALARAVLAGRTGKTPAALEDERVRQSIATSLPLPWAAQLAAAWFTSQPIEAREIVERLVAAHGERTRAALREVAQSGAPRLAKGAAGLLGTVPVGSVTVAVRVLGPAEIVVGGRPVESADWRRGKVRALLCLLAHERMLRREDAMARLWPDLDEQAARHNLRVTLNYLQRLFEPERQSGEAPFYLRQEGDGLRLLEEPHVTTDVETFQRILDRADRLRSDGQLELAAQDYAAAFAHWRGPYLDDVADEEWAHVPRTRLSNRAVTARTAWASICLALDRAAEAVDVSLAALEVDPWSEAVHRLIVAAHLARGDRLAARRALDDLDAVLDELGVPPSPQTEALARRLGERDEAESGAG